MISKFENLPKELKLFHSLKGRFSLTGQCEVFGADNLLGMIISKCLNLPSKSAKSSLTFELDACESSETWLRRFPNCNMYSTMTLIDGVLVEKIGFLEFFFKLNVENESLRMQISKLMLFGWGLPQCCLPNIQAVERGENGQLFFDVTAALPFVGRLVAYKGWLELSSMERL